jgi:hypothetical protein
MCHFGVKHFKYTPAITNNIVRIKGHPKVENKIVTSNFVEKSNLSNMKIPRKKAMYILRY